MDFIEKSKKNTGQPPRKTYSRSDIVTNESQIFNVDTEALLHLMIQRYEKENNIKLTDSEYQELLDIANEHYKAGEYTFDDYGESDDPEIKKMRANYEKREKEMDRESEIRLAISSYEEFMETHSYSKAHKLFAELLGFQEKINKMSKLAQYPKLVSKSIKELERDLGSEIEQSLKGFIGQPSIDLFPLLRKKENQLFEDFKYYREKSISRFKKKDVINKHRTELVIEIDEILDSIIFYEGDYHRFFNEYKNYNLSIINS